jgi:HrpA-like RNA helicase
MSGLPTLLRKNFVVPPKGSSEKQKEIIKNTISIDYILRKISDMIPHGAGSSPKNTPVNFGDKFIILKANTGSGKSTVLPAALYETFFEYTHKGIIVTQPRILTAIDIPSTIVPFNPRLKLGKNIGYNTGPFKLALQEKGIVFSTIGVLSQELIMNTDEEFMRKYQFIVIDEVHERDIDTDKCLYLLKKLIAANYKDPACPVVILMSATFNEDIFMRYFEIPEENFIQVVGATFPIENIFSDFSIADYIKYASLKAQKIHMDNFADFDHGDPNCDIIIFVKDSGVGKKIYDDMHLFNSNILSKDDTVINAYKDLTEFNMNALFKTGGAVVLEKKYYILPILLDTKSFSQGGLEYQNLFSSLDIISTPIWKVLTDQEGAISIDIEMEPVNRVIASRRVIITTNLAETGVTIPTLKYCIDTGYQLSSEFYPEYGCFALIAKNITYGSAIQRKGRVGRKTPGIWYPCYTKETFDALPREHLANILTNDTTDTLLSILIREKNVTIEQEYHISRIKDHDAYGMFQMYSDQLILGENWFSIKNEFKTNISAIDFIELPSIQSLNYSIEKLHLLGFMDDNYDITVTGFFANKFRFISLDSRKMILSGYNYGASILDLITIAAFIYVSKRKIFTKKFKLENFLKINDEEFELYNTTLVADDFINCLFVWNLIQKYITANMSRDISLGKIRFYCEKNEIIYDGLTKVIEIRNIIIENLIDIGLDPYYNALKIPNYNLNNILLKSLSDGLIETNKIKNCMYEGYRCNILTHVKNNIYISQTKGLQINIRSKLIQSYNITNNSVFPKYILVDVYSLSQKMGQAQYEFIAEGFISILDNFINVDEKFVKN